MDCWLTIRHISISYKLVLATGSKSDWLRGQSGRSLIWRVQVQSWNMNNLWKMQLRAELDVGTPCMHGYVTERVRSSAAQGQGFAPGA